MSRECRRRSREREPSPGRHQRRCHSRGRQPPPSQLPRERNQVHERVQAMTPLASPGRLNCWPGSPLTGKMSGNAESRVSLSVIELSEAIARGMSRATGKSLPETLERQVSLNTSLQVNIIAEFNPLNGDIEEWLNSVDECATMYRWSDSLTSYLALGKLRGPAETWYRGLPTRMFAWPEWRQMLAENFAVKRDLHRALQIMMDCKPKARQSLYEYTYEKLALIHKLKLPLSGADQVNLIMSGINDKQIRFTVEAAGIKSPSELAKHFRGAECNAQKPVGLTRDARPVQSSRPASQRHYSNSNYKRPITSRVPNIYLSTIGTERIPVTHSTWVDITLDNITKHIELLLVTECVRDVEILTGQNFTELADTEYYKCGDKLQLVQTRCLNSVECLEIKNYQVEVGTIDPVAVNKPLTILNKHPQCLANTVKDIGQTSTTVARPPPSLDGYKRRRIP
jgi:hypothetical protein